MSRLRDSFSGNKRDAFRLVETGDAMIGTLRIESRNTGCRYKPDERVVSGISVALVRSAT